MTVKLLTGHHLEHQTLKGSCLGSSESIVVKIHVVENHMSQLICRKKLCRSISTGFKRPDYADLYSLTANIRGAFGKFLAWYFISVTDLQTILCLVSFKEL